MVAHADREDLAGIISLFDSRGAALAAPIPTSDGIIAMLVEVNEVLLSAVAASGLPHRRRGRREVIYLFRSGSQARTSRCIFVQCGLLPSSSLLWRASR